MGKASKCIEMLTVLKARINQGPISSAVLAKKLNTNPRNIREYRKELEDAGYRIEETMGPYGGYSLAQDSFFPILNWNSEEIDALRELYLFLEKNPELTRSDQAILALEKALASLEPDTKKSIYYIAGPQNTMTDKMRDFLDLSQKAITLNRVLILSYQSVNDIAPQERIVDPYDIVYYRGVYYLVAYSHDRQDYRIYRFSSKRMHDMSLSKRYFVQDSQYQLHHVISKFGLVKDDVCQIVVEVDNHVVDRFEEYDRWGFDLKCLSKEQDVSIYTFKNADRYELFRQIFSYDGTIRILEPYSYQEEFMQKIKQWL